MTLIIFFKNKQIRAMEIKKFYLTIDDGYIIFTENTENVKVKLSEIRRILIDSNVVFEEQSDSPDDEYPF